jgi:DNA-binding IclR family transcriptional regulator
VRGISAISAPIREPGGIVTAALTIAGPGERCSQDKLRSWVPELTKATLEISELLGRSRGPIGPPQAQE